MKTITPDAIRPQKEHAARLGISVRQLRRRLTQFKIVPVDFNGKEPLYTESDILSMEFKRKAERLNRYTGKRGGIITIKEAKRIAKRTMGRRAA